MISYATNITSSADRLQNINIEQLYGKIKYPDDDVKNLVRQLRIVRTVDKGKYNAMKRSLPYVVCAKFNPQYRRTENFAYTEFFIVDIDHLSEKKIDMEAIRAKLQSDSRVLMCFVSPGEDGLKLVFRMKERCYDAGIYSLFYKMFVADLSRIYNLEQVIDSRTCDVCRACFLSVDTNVYYNENAESVDIKQYLSEENPIEIYTLKKQYDNMVLEPQNNMSEEAKREIDPDIETMNRIRATLNPSIVQKEQRIVYVPEILNSVISAVKQDIEECGLIVDGITDIQYGKKINCKLGVKSAEANLFYGKRGFSVVSTPKRGTSEQLNQLLYDIINNSISKYA